MERTEDGVSVRVEAVLPHAPDQVWAALRKPHEWWVREARVVFRKGGKYHTRQPSGWVEGKIVALTSKRKLAVVIPFSTPNVWIETTLTVSLKSERGKTRIVFDHEGPEVMAWMGELRNLEKGWRETLVKLSNYLKGIH